jgi:hypothetical protein
MRIEVVFTRMSALAQSPSKCSAVASSVTKPEISCPISAPRIPARRNGPIATSIINRLVGRCKRRAGDAGVG